MRTTLTLDDALLEAAASLAKARGTHLGEVISEWARRGLAAESAAATRPDGFPVFAARGKPITSQQVKALLDDEGTGTAAQDGEDHP